MNFKINLDFCVIPSPSGLRNLVFIAYGGTNSTNENLCLEDEYKLVRELLNKYGYKEIDFCAFESTDDSLIHVEEFKLKLVEAGMRYSKPFEFSIIGEVDLFYKELIYRQESNNIHFTNNSPAIIYKTKSKIPKVGEKITIYFNLFLQCFFLNENDCALEFVGDLYSKENNNFRNFLHTTKSEFTRMESSIPSAIILQSDKTYGDFINEISFLHKGVFIRKTATINAKGDILAIPKEYVYDIIHIRKNINPNLRIVVEANISQHYDNMISESKKIKKQFTQEQKKIISLEIIKPEALVLKQKLNNKMINFAESEEFEKANKVKNDINFIDNKIDVIDNLEKKNITRAEYLKIFCLNS